MRGIWLISFLVGLKTYQHPCRNEMDLNANPHKETRFQVHCLYLCRKMEPMHRTAKYDVKEIA